jgi:hypothetical protein
VGGGLLAVVNLGLRGLGLAGRGGFDLKGRCGFALVVTVSFWFDLLPDLWWLVEDLWWLVEDVVGFCRIFVVGFVGSAGPVRSDLVVVVLKR